MKSGAVKKLKKLQLGLKKNFRKALVFLKLWNTQKIYQMKLLGRVEILLLLGERFKNIVKTIKFLSKMYSLQRLIAIISRIRNILLAQLIVLLFMKTVKDFRISQFRYFWIIFGMFQLQCVWSQLATHSGISSQQCGRIFYEILLHTHNLLML